MNFLKPIANFRWDRSVSQFFGVNRAQYAQFRNRKGQPLPGHNGLDIVAQNNMLGYGTEIRAVLDFDACSLETDFPVKTSGSGIRTYTHFQAPFPVGGRMVSTVEVIYWHLSDFDIKAGSAGRAGDIIGKMGNTGQVFPRPSNSCELCPYYGTHLHMAWRGYDERGAVIDNDYDGYRNPVPFMILAGEKLPVSLYRDLFWGCEGDDVAWLQTLLKIEFPDLPFEPIGIFGSQTVAAVVQLQKKYALTPALGYVGPKTRSLLSSKYCL